MVDTFHRVARLAGIAMRSASKESRHHLPVWRDRGRSLHLANVR